MKHSILALLLLSSCGSTTSTTITQPDGKSVNTIVKKDPPSDTIITKTLDVFSNLFFELFQAER